MFEVSIIHEAKYIATENNAILKKTKTVSILQSHGNLVNNLGSISLFFPILQCSGSQYTCIEDYKMACPYHPYFFR